MINEQKKMTAPESSVGADAKQPVCNNNEIISNQKQVGNLQATNSVEKSSAPVNAGAENLDAKSLVEILDTTFPPQIPLIEDFLYTGTYLFAGAPKMGKSFFMAQIGFHISRGTPMWNHEVHKGTVLYLALEDNFARIQKRLSKMFDMKDSDKFFFAIDAKSLNEGLDMQMENFTKEHPDTKLIIIDTLQKIREVGGDKYSYASDYEIITLASIIEREAANVNEHKKVAGVFYNRIKSDMLLQSCATVQYILKERKPVLSVEDTKIDSPYNTYINRGLPPSPICMPSMDAINAVLNFEKHEYIFFCARPTFDGYHNFARTLKEHNANARAYQNELNKRKIK